MRGLAPTFARCLLTLLLLWSNAGYARDTDLVLFPTRVDAATAAQNRLTPRATELDQLLREAAVDLNLALVAPPALPVPTDEHLPDFAKQNWVVAPVLSEDSQGVKLTLTAVAPGSRVLMTRMQHLQPSQLEVKAIVMLQDLVQAGREPHDSEAMLAAPHKPGPVDDAPASDGRAILALNTVLYGGYIGFTVQRASGSTDNRLVYPLVALGAGLGLGASMLVADEWDISEGTAWYLSAGLVWPTLAGISLGEAYDDRPEYRHLYGLLGATSGLTLATTVVSLHDTTPGQAALTHSGGAFGTLLGGLTQALIEAEHSELPLVGLGYGAAGGVLLAGALAPTANVSSSRVLFIDLSTSLGGLTGAAVSAPALLVQDEVTDGRRRVVFASVIAGLVLGAAIGTWVTSDVPVAEDTGGPYTLRPQVGFMDFSEAEDGALRPLYGAGVSGTW